MAKTTAYNEASEEFLLARMAEGDKQAFQVLYERYHKGVYRYGFLMLGDSSAAADIYQETFLTLYKNCREGKNIRSVRGYLISIVRSRCLDYMNSSRRYVSLEHSPEQSFEFDEARADTKEHLYQALSRIPEQYREAFVLFTLNDYSYLEIEQMLGVSRNVVKNRIYRAKQGLQKILNPLLNDTGDGKESA